MFKGGARSPPRNKLKHIHKIKDNKLAPAPVGALKIKRRLDYDTHEYRGLKSYLTKKL